jgi:hypothetical protein
VAVSRVEITVFPLGSAVMFVTLNWNPKRSISKVSIEELRTWLFLSKFRHKSIVMQSPSLPFLSVAPICLLLFIFICVFFFCYSISKL